MSVSQIPNLTPATSLNGSEQLEAVQAGSSVRLTTAQIGTYVASTYPAPGISSVTANSPLSSSTTSGAVTIYLPTAAITNTYLGQMAAGTVKANLTGGTASPSDVLPSAILDTFSATPGTTLYRGSSSWVALPVGTNSQVLTINGSLPSWRSLSVTTSQIANSGVTAGTYGTASNVAQITVLASGQISSSTNVPIAIAASQVSGLAPSATIDTTNASNITSGVLASARYTTTLSAALDSSAGSTQGSILYRSATGWTQLGPGTPGQVLQTQGSSANPLWAAGSGSGTVTSVATGTGLTGGPITSSGTISIANTAVTAGSYGSSAAVGTFTVNGQGQITAASNTTINAVTLTTGSITTAPVNASDLVNKSYVDAAVSGVNYHAACNWATTADLGSVTYNNGASGVGATITKTSPFSTLAVDGGSPTVGQRILVKNETSGQYNGIYTVTSVGSGAAAWVLTRATDYDQTGAGQNEIAPGDTTFILSGTANANTQWVQTTDNPIVIGTTPLVFVQIGATVSYTAGIGLTLSGTTFSITNTAVTSGSYGSASSVGTFTVNAQGQLTAAASTSIAIAASQITSGTITVPQGGTGATTLTGYLKGNGTSAFTAVSSIPSGDITGLGTMSTQNANSVTITGGTINGTAIGGTTPSSGAFTTLGATGNATLATITAGTWNGSTIAVAYGGTGQSTALTQYGIVYGASTTAMAVTAAGTTGQVLVATTGAAPSWATLGSVAATSISFGTTGLTPATATTGAVVVAGTLVAANGGTGQSSYTVGDLLYASGTTALSKLADVATGSVLVSGGVGVAPAYSATPALTSLTAPTVYGGTGAASSLTLQSTSGAGTTDSIVMKVGNAGATTAVSIATTGIVSFPTTGAIVVPVGTTAQEPGTPATGMLRFNSTTTSFEGYNGTAWGSIGGGATGGGTDQIFYLNGQTVNSNYTIASTNNAGTFGPITIASGVVVTVSAGATWSIV